VRAATLAERREGGAGTRPPAVWTVYVWELEKLTAQLRVRIAAAACLAGPFMFAAALKAQDSVPSDTLFGRWVHFTGFATPLVVLTFVAQWALPLMIALVAGDIFAAEDHLGTWKTILTRSCGRTRLFWGKTLAAATYTIVVVLLLALGSLAAGVLVIGHQPLVTLSGTLVPAGHATGLVLAAWATVLLPALGFTALGVLFSIATRNGPAGIICPAVIGLLMQLYSFVNGADVVRHLLLTTPFFAWHGLLLRDPDYYPLQRGAVVCAVYAAGCLAAGWVLLRRRDFTEG
jgi:ABC-2 type transport system permease protein